MDPRLIIACLLAVIGLTAARYNSHAEMRDFLDNMASLYPSLTRRYNLSRTSVEGLELMAIVISRDPEMNPEILIPKVKYIGNIHGNEVVGRQILQYLIQYLLENYESDERVATLVNTTQIHIIPSMNPDGFAKALPRLSVDGPCIYNNFGRKNAHGVDLHRNFPDEFVDNNVPREPETVAILDLLEAEQFVLSASLLGGTPLLVNYPFDNYLKSDIVEESRYAGSDNDDVLRRISKTYSMNHPKMHLGGHCGESPTEFKNGTVNGAQWYPITGGMQDANYHLFGCMEVTLELSCCKYVNVSDLEQHWEDNKISLLAYLEQVHSGVKGLVVDSETGDPISGATMYVLKRTDFNIRTTTRGEYWRLLEPGAYTLHVDASGYDSIEQDVNVTESEALRQDIELTAKKQEKCPANDLSTISCSVATTLIMAAFVHFGCF